MTASEWTREEIENMSTELWLMLVESAEKRSWDPASNIMCFWVPGAVAVWARLCYDGQSVL